MSVPAHAPFDYQALIDSKSGKKQINKQRSSKEYSKYSTNFYDKYRRSW